MHQFMRWLRAHKFEAHLTAFLLITLPPAAMHMAAENNAALWIWLFLGVVICGNLFTLFIK